MAEAIKHTSGLAVNVPKRTVAVRQEELNNWFDGEHIGPRLGVINYEAARKMDIASWGIDVVVADESHRLKSYNSKQSVALAKSCKDIPYKIAMTGTAFEDRPTDLYGQERWLYPAWSRGRLRSERISTWGNFFEKFVKYYVMDNIKIPTGYKNLDEMVLPHLLTINTDDVLDLPEAHHITREVQATPALRKQYNEMRDEMLTEIDGEMVVADNPMTKALRLHQITSGGKLEALMGLVEEIGNQPFVVFTRFRNDVVNISRELNTRDYYVDELTGEMDSHESWKAGHSQALIANMQAGSTGVDFSRASVAIYFSVGYSRTDYHQSLARLRRPGADRPITYYHLVMDNTIDETIEHILNTKGSVADEFRRRFI